MVGYYESLYLAVTVLFTLPEPSDDIFGSAMTGNFAIPRVFSIENTLGMTKFSCVS